MMFQLFHQSVCRRLSAFWKSIDFIRIRLRNKQCGVIRGCLLTPNDGALSILSVVRTELPIRPWLSDYCLMIGVSVQLAVNCRKTPDRANWLSRLPSTVRELEQRWFLTLGEPFDDEVSCAWVTTVILADGSPAVMKLGTDGE